MKKIATIIILILSIGSLTKIRAGEPENGTMINVPQLIQKSIQYPEFLKNQELEKQNLKVRISFLITANGEKEILVVNAPNEQLKNYVVNAILNLNIQPDIETNREYNLIINFCLV